MSKERDRRLARERYERQQARRAALLARRRRRNATISGILAVLAVLGAVAYLALRGGNDVSTTPAATSSPAPTSSPTPTSSVSASPRPSGSAAGAAVGLRCTPAPSPRAAAEFTAPSGAAATSATLVTNCGSITVRLLADKAPKTVQSFSFLARQKFFDRTPCHRLTTEGLFVLQCGDPTGGGSGGPGYTIPLENAPATGTYPPGTVAMARSTDPGSGGSQFFIVYKASELPAPGYSIFGTVTKGLDIVTKIGRAGAAGGADGAPLQPIGITSVQLGR